MSTSLRPAGLLFAALSLLAFEGQALARTTGPSLSDEIKLEGTSESGGAVQHKDASATGEAEARVRALRVCKIPRHPRDGIPASIHACPLVFAAADESAAAPATRTN